MAGNSGSGNVLVFKMTDKQLESAISQYKTDLKNDVFERASWPHFCAYLGYTEKEVEDVIHRVDEVGGGAYSERATMLRRVACWIRGEILSGKGWGGQNQSKAIFALKQDVGDGMRYDDYKTAAERGVSRIKIDFGNGDPRSKKAMK